MGKDEGVRQGAGAHDELKDVGAMSYRAMEKAIVSAQPYSEGLAAHLPPRHCQHECQGLVQRPGILGRTWTRGARTSRHWRCGQQQTRQCPRCRTRGVHLFVPVQRGGQGRRALCRSESTGRAGSTRGPLRGRDIARTSRRSGVIAVATSIVRASSLGQALTLLVLRFSGHDTEARHAH